MKFKPFFYLLFFVCYMTFSQQSFEKGYIVTDSGQKVEGFVDLEKNLKSSNEKILYRKGFKTQNEYYDLAQIAEIHLDRGVKYVKELVEYDKDYVGTNNSLVTDFNKNPTMETVLLEVLLEGEANLYSFEKNEKKVFYVKKVNENINYLFYKKITNSSGEQKENGFFRQQLFENFKCMADSSIVPFLKIKYSKEDLVAFFDQFNSCKGNNTYSQTNTRQKPVFKFAPLLGLLINNIELTSDDSGFQLVKEDFSETSMFFGVEVSVKFPKHNFRYEIFSRLIYTKSDYSKYLLDVNEALNRTTEREYSFSSGNINFLIGPRYYFNSNGKSRIFVDAAFGFIIPSGDLKSKTTFTNVTGGNTFVETNEEIFETSVNFVPSIGVGYLYDNKFSLDIRMDTANNFTKSYSDIKFRQLPFYLSAKYILF